MNFSRAVFLINKNLRCIACMYDPEEGLARNTKKFKTLDPSIKVDDLVVIPTGTRAKMTVVKVTEVDLPVDLDDPAQLEWVVQRVDTESHAKRVHDEQIAIKALQSADNRRKSEELMAALSKDNPELAAQLAGLSVAQITAT